MEGKMLLFGIGRGGFVNCEVDGLDGVEGGGCARVLSHWCVPMQRSRRETVAPH